MVMFMQWLVITNGRLEFKTGGAKAQFDGSGDVVVKFGNVLNYV